MNLNETLTMIAAQIRTDATTLIAYAAEDNLGGYHYNAKIATFPPGSIWGVEGQILYALVRLLKPEMVVEIGGWAGCSAAHLALAVKANGSGVVHSVDNGSELNQFTHGQFVPDELRPFIHLHKQDGEKFLNDLPDRSIGLLFEDASHVPAMVTLLTSIGLKKVVEGGIIANHDAGHGFAYDGNGQVSQQSDLGKGVRDGLAMANAYFRPYLADPSDCGLAITQVPVAIKDPVKMMDTFTRPAQSKVGGNWGSVPTVPVGNAHIESDGLLKPQAIETTADPSIPPMAENETPKPKRTRKSKSEML